MTHFHVMMVSWPHPLVSLPFDNYEDSLVTYVKLSNAFYGHNVKSGQLSLENAKHSTMNGEADGSYMGAPTCGIFWVKCDLDPCMHGSWN